MTGIGRAVGELDEAAFRPQAVEGGLQDRLLRLPRHRQQAEPGNHRVGAAARRGSRCSRATSRRLPASPQTTCACRELPDQVLVQFLVELEHQQVRRGDAVVEQGLGEHAGAAAQLDDAPAVPRQLRHHLPRQLLAGGRDGGDPQRVLQPLPEEGPARRQAGERRRWIPCPEHTAWPGLSPGLIGPVPTTACRDPPESAMHRHRRPSCSLALLAPAALAAPKRQRAATRVRRRRCLRGTQCLDPATRAASSTSTTVTCWSMAAAHVT